MQELKASSLSELINGIIIIPITIPADNELKPANPGIIFCKKGVTTIRAKKPYTTVGTAAKISRRGLIVFFIFIGRCCYFCLIEFCLYSYCVLLYLFVVLLYRFLLFFIVFIVFIMF